MKGGDRLAYGPSARVLLIEDDARIASFVTRGLRRDGVEITAVEDGEVGAFLATTEAFDVFILDLELPSLGGLEVLDRMTSNRPGVPVVVLTANDIPTVRRRVMETGAAAYLTKPFVFEELRNTVAGLLAGGRCGSTS